MIPGTAYQKWKCKQFLYLIRFSIWLIRYQDQDLIRLTWTNQLISAGKSWLANLAMSLNPMWQLQCQTALLLHI